MIPILPASIKRLRVELHLTQVEFARAVGVHPITVSRWECGVVTPEGTTEVLLRTLHARVEERRPPRNISERINRSNDPLTEIIETLFRR